MPMQPFLAVDPTEAGVAIAAIGLAASALGGIITVVKLNDRSFARFEKERDRFEKERERVSQERKEEREELRRLAEKIERLADAVKDFARIRA